MGSCDKPATIMLRLLIVAGLLAICCGVKSPGRVLGGAPIPIEEVPYQVAILYQNSLRCAGAILTDRVIVSVAKCYRQSDSDQYQIRAGSSNFNKGGQLVDVKTVVSHEKYPSGIAFEYNIALFVLNGPIALDGVTTATVSLPQSGLVLPPGTLGLAAGWGSDSDAGVNWSENLLALRLPATEFAACRDSYAQIFRFVADSMICAGTAETALCNGDSGAPLVVDNVLVGLMSWNGGCVEGPWNWPDVFTSVSYFSDWLQKHLQLLDN